MPDTPGLVDLLRAAPSSFHTAAYVAAELVAAGFTELTESVDWPSGAGRFVVVRDGAVVAWVVPGHVGPTTPLRIIGAHTDSPTFMLKPEPSFVTEGVLQVDVEVYGGPLLNSWLDRELIVAGRIVTTDGTAHCVRTGPLLRIPQLAIHLDREQNAGLTLDRQRHMQPVWGVASEGGPTDILEIVAAAAGVARDDIAGHTLVLADSASPAHFGADGALLAAGRLDNLSSVWAGLHALRTVGVDAPYVTMLAAFDHEELGSASRTGAAGPLLQDVLTRLAVALDASAIDRQRAYAASWLISADAGHAVHPNYPDRHDPHHRPRLGNGPLLKVNAAQRYATDAHGAAFWSRACAQAGVSFQTFVSHNGVPCGSTIGPLAATRLGIRTVDVGTPLLSMHSARELAHTADLAAFAAALTAALTTL